MVFTFRSKLEMWELLLFNIWRKKLQTSDTPRQASEIMEQK